MIGDKKVFFKNLVLNSLIYTLLILFLPAVIASILGNTAGTGLFVASYFISGVIVSVKIFNDNSAKLADKDRDTILRSSTGILVLGTVTVYAISIITEIPWL